MKKIIVYQVHVTGADNHELPFFAEKRGKVYEPLAYTNHQSAQDMADHFTKSTGCPARVHAVQGWEFEDGDTVTP